MLPKDLADISHLALPGYAAGLCSLIIPAPPPVAPIPFRAFFPPVLKACGAFLRGQWARNDPRECPVFRDGRRASPWIVRTGHVGAAWPIFDSLAVAPAGNC